MLIFLFFLWLFLGGIGVWGCYKAGKFAERDGWKTPQVIVPLIFSSAFLWMAGGIYPYGVQPKLMKAQRGQPLTAEDTPGGPWPVYEEVEVGDEAFAVVKSGDDIRLLRRDGSWTEEACQVAALEDDQNALRGKTCLKAR